MMTTVNTTNNNATDDMGIRVMTGKIPATIDDARCRLHHICAGEFVIIDRADDYMEYTLRLRVADEYKAATSSRIWEHLFTYKDGETTFDGCMIECDELPEARVARFMRQGKMRVIELLRDGNIDSAPVKVWVL